MKTLKQLKYSKYCKERLNEEIASEEIDRLAANETERLQKELEKLLGSHYTVNAYYSTNLGRSVHVRVWGENPPHNIKENSPAFMSFMMYLSSGFGKSIGFKKISWEMATGHYKQRDAGIKFRKISSSKSLEDANNKLVKWFKDNKSKLDSLMNL